MYKKQERQTIFCFNWTISLMHFHELIMCMYGYSGYKNSSVFATTIYMYSIWNGSGIDESACFIWMFISLLSKGNMLSEVVDQNYTEAHSSTWNLKYFHNFPNNHVDNCILLYGMLSLTAATDVEVKYNYIYNTDDWICLWFYMVNHRNHDVFCWLLRS